jgi:putative transposase
LDNVVVERFWRNVKYEHVYLHAAADGRELYRGLQNYMDFYCNRRVHEALGYAIPAEVYAAGKTA